MLTGQYTFVYWITTNIITLITASILRRPSVRQYLRVAPRPPKERVTKPTFRGSIKWAQEHFRTVSENIEKRTEAYQAQQLKAAGHQAKSLPNLIREKGYAGKHKATAQSAQTTKWDEM